MLSTSLRPLRLKLTLWYLLTLCAIILLLGGGLFVAIGNRFAAELDQSLRAATAQLERAAQTRELEAHVRGKVVDAVEELHIADRSLSGQSFTFAARELELLIRANDFEPKRDLGRIVFALRGAQLVASPTDTAPQFRQVDRDALTLRDTRPDHKTQRCVIGVYDLNTQRLSGFSSSTVPHRRAVYTY